MADDRDIFIAMPVYGGLQAQTAGTLFNALGFLINRGIKSHLVFKPDCACIDFARCELMSQFIVSESTHMLFIDADVAFEPDVPFRMLEADEDIISVIYARRGEPHDPVVNADFTKSTFTGKSGERLFGIHSSGMGCTMISKKAALRMCEAYPHLLYYSNETKKDGYALFQPLIRQMNGHPAYMGEDISFFYRALEMGIKPVCLVDVSITHDKYPLCFADSLKAVQEEFQKKGRNIILLKDKTDEIV